MLQRGSYDLRILLFVKFFKASTAHVHYRSFLLQVTIHKLSRPNFCLFTSISPFVEVNFNSTEIPFFGICSEIFDYFWNFLNRLFIENVFNLHAKYFIGDSVCELFRSTPNLWTDDSDYFLKMTILNMYPQAWQLVTGKENIHKP